MIIERAKFVLLDSSILGNLARDFFHADESKRRGARSFVECFRRTGVVPFLCWHQFEELIKHRNDEVARNRVALLKTLPHVAWIESADGQKLGSIVDLLRAECRTVLEHPEYSIQKVRDATRDAIFCFGSGADALEGYDEIWRDLRPHLWEHEERAREIVAISRASVVDISEEKLETYLSGSIRSPHESQAILENFRPKMANEVASRGDRRISDPSVVAADFYSEIEKGGAVFSAQAGMNPQSALEHFGVCVSDFGPDARMKDVMALSEFRSKLRVAHRSFDMPWEKFKSTISIEKVPSWAVQNSLFLYGQVRDEHKGSELNDRYLASFSPYCALTYVDAQVKEDIRRALTKSDDLKVLMNPVDKVTTLERVQRRLESGDF